MTNAIDTVSNSMGHYIQSENTAPRLMKCVATVGAIGLSVIGSFALAYFSPTAYLFTTLGVGAVQLLTLSKLLKNGDSPLGRVVLTASLVALGALTLAGPSLLSYFFIKELVASQSLILLNALLTSFFVTGLIGYGIPLGTQFLKKAYLIMNDPTWRERVELLAQKLRLLPDSDWESFSPISTLTAFHSPEYLAQNHGWMSEGASLTLKVMHPEYALSEFKKQVNGLQRINALYAQLNALNPTERRIVGDLYNINHDHERQKLKVQMKKTLGVLHGEELKEAAEILLEKVSTLVPNALTAQEFNQLLQGPLLDCFKERMNKFCSAFSGSLDGLNGSFIRLKNELIFLERDMNHPPRITNEYENRLSEIQNQFQQQREKLDTLNKERQCWQNLVNAGITNQDFPGEAFHTLMNDQAMMQRLSQLHRESMGVQSQGNPETLFALLQRLTSRLGAQNQAQAEPTSAWEFLGTNRCNFRVPEYEEIRKWLKVDSLADIESKFEEIGLRTEQDLYQNNILPQNGVVAKETIKNNLKQYIEAKLAERADLRNRAYSLLSATTSHLTPTGTLGEKMSKAFYRVATMIMILVPIYFCPIAGAIGIGIGGLFLTLRHFNVWGTTTIAEICSASTTRPDFNDPRIYHLDGWILHWLVSSIAGRRFFTLTPGAQQNMEIFAQTDFFGKLRILNAELAITLSAVTIGRFFGLGDTGRNLGEMVSLGAIPGSFVQGVALSHEMALH